MCCVTHPDSGLCEVGPHGYLLPGAHVRVTIALEGGLQFLQLLAGEMSPLPPLPLLLGRVVRRVVIFILDLFFFYKKNIGILYHYFCGFCFVKNKIKFLHW